MANRHGKEGARKLSGHAHHERRKQAVRLHCKGMKVGQIANTLGMVCNTVRSIAVAEQGGFKALVPRSVGRAWSG